MNTNKPLSEWTLAEVNAECKKYEICDPECPAYINEYGRAVRCSLRFAPSTWDLTEPPRWTEQEVQDAKSIVRMFGADNFAYVTKDENGWPVLADDCDGCANFTIGLEKGIFPSLKSGQTVKLDDIIGGQ